MKLALPALALLLLTGTPSVLIGQEEEEEQFLEDDERYEDRSQEEEGDLGEEESKDPGLMGERDSAKNMFDKDQAPPVYKPQQPRQRQEERGRGAAPNLDVDPLTRHSGPQQL